jgi:phosphatidylserine decarboxylase
MKLNENDIQTQLELEKLLDRNEPEFVILATLKSLRYKNIDKRILNKLFNYALEGDYNDFNGEKYKFNPDFFVKKDYNCFMDFFLRKISKEKKLQISNNLENCQMIIPNECNIRTISNITETDKLFQLKKKFDKTVLENMYNMGISNIDNYNFIDMNLWVSYYHRIHAAVSGVITELIPIEQDDNIFGDNSLWVMKIETEKSPVYHMLVGESLIQDFNFFVEKGDKIKIFDEIGHFAWGSQTVLLYNPEDYKDIKIKENTKYFVGDCIF